MATNFKKETKELTTQLFELIGIKAKITIDETVEDEQKVIGVHIEAPDEAGLLIGAHGATLASIQVFIGMALRQKFGEFVRIVVDIGDWKQKQEEYLASLAEQTSLRAKQTGEPQHLYNLSPSQRRIIHVKLSEDQEIETRSEGEGNERYLIVTPKKA